MAMFVKNKSGSRKNASSKHFFVRKKKVTKNRTAIVRAIPPKPTKSEHVDTPKLAQESRRPENERQAKRTFTQTPSETKPSPLTEVLPEAKTQLSDINRMIHEKAFLMKEDMSDEAVEDATRAGPLFIDTPNTFDGVSNTDEKIRLVEAELVEAQRRARKLEHEMSLLKTEFEEERKTYEHTVKDLKQELHRTAPLHDNKFFSLSKELRAAMDEIKTISNTPGDEPLARHTELTNTPSTAETIGGQRHQEQKPLIANPNGAGTPKREVTHPGMQETNMESKDNSGKTLDMLSENKGTKKPRKKKLLVTGAAAVTTLLIIGGGVGYEYLSKPTVDQKLVAEYMQKQQAGEVAGATTNQTNTQASAKPTPSDAEVPMSETTWETYNDPILGITIQYPGNVVTLNKTDSSVTFLRKDGYLFKAQRVDTKLGIKDYWEQIKATTMNYDVKQTTFREKPALYLHLTDTTDFPGDRYLVQLNGYIFDIWYATKSSKFSTDDLTRAQKMLESVRFI